MARQRDWIGPKGHRLLLDVKAEKEAGLSETAALRKVHGRPPWNEYEHEHLARKYWVAKKHFGDSPPPLPDEPVPADSRKIDAQLPPQWISDLEEWGVPREEARELSKRALGVAEHQLPHVDWLFERMRGRRHWNGRQKINHVRQQIDTMISNPRYVPISGLGRPDRNAGLVLHVLAKGPATKEQIQAATGIKPTTLQNLLVSMVRSGEILRIRRAHYALPMDGLVAHVSTDAAILDVLAISPAFSMKFASVPA
jgi:hypothetical protein